MSSSYTILVADDEPNLRLSLGQILSEAGYLALTASSGHEALAMLEAGPCDLVILDLNMPGMGGITALTKMRQLYPQMPILILTGHATLESAVEALRSGASDYFFKPLDPTRLLTRIREILATQNSQRRREILEQIGRLWNELQEIESAIHSGSLLEAAPEDAKHILQRGQFTLDLRARQVQIGSRVVSLQGYAFDYLATLVRHAPNAVTYQILVFESQRVQLPYIKAQEMTRWWIYQLRKVVEPVPAHPEFILTVRGTGYRLNTK